MSRAPVRIDVVPFTPAHLPAFIRFSRRTWTRPDDEAYFRWRYLEAPAQRILLAMSGDTIAATLMAFERDYLIGGRRRSCLEIFDWYCLDEYRGAGIGTRLMRSLMDAGTPIVAVGGTTFTLTLLPRLGWRRLAVASCHRLPLGGRSTGESLQRRYRIPARAGALAFDALLRPWFAPRVRARPAGGEVRLASAPGEELLALYEGRTGYDLLPLPHLPHLRWLTGGWPPLGPFRILHFMQGGVLRGWTLLRVYGPEGRREVNLLDLYAPRPDEALYTWMISESLVRAGEFRPEAVNSQSACPILARALRRNRFLSSGDTPIHVWPADFAEGTGAMHMVQNASDGAFIPYPTV
ncbi:MAG TPA: GNAT family N-acetyltransferase [Candidatus Polarisedimenticolia bacterium]|nr:GNAT family N-acetyltransferase [Candidatus Polarisedimenticolia bacterium]